MIIITDDCKACGMCLDYCHTGAIEIKDNDVYSQCTINQDKCKGCGDCLQVDCPGDAIKEVKDD